MFTRDSIVLSNNIKTPLTALSKAVGSNGILKYSYNFDEIIRQIFSHQEQGFAYDPNDLTTLYQDAAGTIPVTSTGQPVGLILDKSKGLVLGPELVTNGDFSNGTTGWSATSASLAVVNNTCTVTATTVGSIRVGQSIPTVVGKTYRASVVILSLSVGTNFVARVGASIGEMSTTNATSPTSVAKTMTMYFVATSTNTVIYTDMTASAIDQKYSVTGFTCKELAGNHAYQTTSASRPLLQRNATTGAYYLAFDGSDDFLQTNSIDFTGTDKVRLFAGVRKLSDAATGTVLELSPSKNTNTGVFSLFAPLDSGAAQIVWVSKGTIERAAAATLTAAPVSTVISANSNISGRVLQLRIDGVTNANNAGSQGTGNFGNYPLYIGRRGGTVLPFNGHIYSLIGIGRLTTDSETVAIEKELAKRLGVTLNV